MSPHCAETSSFRQETLSSLCEHRALVDTNDRLLLAGNSLPEVRSYRNDLVGVGAIRVRSDGLEHFAELDSKDLLILLDRSLAVDEVEDFPPEMVGEHIHTERRLQLVYVAIIQVADHAIHELVSSLGLFRRREWCGQRFALLLRHLKRIASRRLKGPWCVRGLPTASVVRSSQATPARRRGQPFACCG